MKYLALLLLCCFLNNAVAQQVDSIAIRQVDSLIQVSRDLTAQRDFDQALAVNAEAETLALETYGRVSAAYGNCAFNRGRVNFYKGDYAEAELWYLQSQSIRENILGKAHPDYAWCLNNLGVLYDKKGLFEKAASFYLEALSIREQVLGIEHMDYAASLHNLGILYSTIGEYEKAGQLLRQARDIRFHLVGPNHHEYANSVNSLAALYFKLGRYDDAEPFFIEARNILIQVRGYDHPDHEGMLNNLAVLYYYLGQYDKSEQMHLEAWAIRKGWGQSLHPNDVGRLLNLANLYIDLCKYDKAESLLLEEMEACIALLGPKHTTCANIFQSLAVLYYKTGQDTKAESLLRESAEIRKEVLGEYHLEYAKSLSFMMELSMERGLFDQSLQLGRKVLEVTAGVLGSAHPYYASRLADYGLAHHNAGRLKEADSLYRESLALLQNSLGMDHPDLYNVLYRSCVLNKEMGRLEEAEIFGIAALRLFEASMGPDHFFNASILAVLAEIYHVQGRHEKVIPLLERMTGIVHHYLSEAGKYSSESDLGRFQAAHVEKLGLILGVLSSGLYGNKLSGLAYDDAVFRKGFLQEASIRRNLLTQRLPTADSLSRILRSMHIRLSREYVLPVQERLGVTELEEQANTLEKQLARTVAGYAEALRQVQWQEVQAALSMDAAAMEFVHFRVNFPQSTDSTMYAALLLRPGATQPTFIPLFEEKEFEHLLAADKERKADYVNDLYAWADRGMVQLGSAKKSLYDLIWAKMEAAGLDGIKTVYYAPSGVLHRLNLGAIAVDDETILSDKYNLVALNSTRQLVIPSSVTTQANDALLVGGVNFELETTLPQLDDQPLLASRSAADAWTESGTRGGTWSYLKWTEREVERISTTLTTGGFNTSQLTGAAATEEAFKSIGSETASPRILHIATHGFFFPGPEQTPSFRRGLGEVEPVFKSSDNPMIRSGLILAGGNYAWQHGRAPRSEMEDGILTAYEISQMNLANTELVVLSACETGLGDIKGNEGVYGLQRAFKIAGAKYLIMSLWQVPDRETMEFMTTFYRNWLEFKMTIPDAFRQTQREMRDRFINPYSWAGFVLVE